MLVGLRNGLDFQRLAFTIAAPCRSGGMADAGDSKSPARKGVPVRVRPPAPSKLRVREIRGNILAIANMFRGSVLEPVFLDLVVDRLERELQQLGGLFLVAARELER